MREFQYEKNSLEKQPWDHYMSLYSRADPADISARTGFMYDPERKEFPGILFLGRSYAVNWPGFGIRLTEERSVEEQRYDPLSEDMHARILLLRILMRGTACRGTGQFRTYRELPGGEVYLRQFDGRCTRRLASLYGDRIQVFRSIMRDMGGRPVQAADAAFGLEVIPGYTVRLLLWEGDEEFPPSARFLFSDNFPLAFAAEDVAQLGDVIINTLKKTETGYGLSDSILQGIC